MVSSGESFKPRNIKGSGLLSGIKAPPGFDVTLFAAPPQISYPVCLAADPNGAVYVGIDENGSLDKKSGRGKIVRCRDRDHDGQADEFIEFAKIDSPRGIVVSPGPSPGSTALFVLHPPHLSIYHDDNGDGVSDRSDVLVKNIGFDLNFRGADHTTNGIQVGIDGWIYVAVGDYGFIKATGSDGREVQMKGGGIARVRPDGSELELVSRGQRNIYDVAISPLMELFTRDNTNDGGGWNVRLSYVPHGAQMGYPSLFVNFPEEIVQPLADYGGGSPCGSLFVDESVLPGDLGHSLYTCDWGRSVVYRHPLNARGAGFSAEQEPFLELPRPTDMDIDAAGSIYVSSWKDGGFNYSNPNVGFIVKARLSSNATPGPKTKLPYEASATSDDLFTGITSGSHTARIQAQREILRRGPKPELVAGLNRIAGSEATPATRVAALFTLKQLVGPKSHEAILALMPDPSIREHLLRVVADRETELSNTSIQPFVVALQDPNPKVRLQAVRGLGRFRLNPSLESPEFQAALKSLVPLTADADPLVAHIAVDSLVRLNAGDVCLKALTEKNQGSRNTTAQNQEETFRDEQTGASLVLGHLHNPAVVKGLLDWLNQKGNSKPAESVGQTSLPHQTRLLVLKTLCRLHFREAEYTGDWWGTRPDTSGPYYKPITWSESERIAAALQEELAGGNPDIVKQLLPIMRRHKLELPGMQERIVKLATDDSLFFPTAVNLVSSGPQLISLEAAHLLELAATFDLSQTALRITALRALQKRVDQPALFPVAMRSFQGVTEQDKAELTSVWDEFVREPKLAKFVEPLARQTESGDQSARELAYAALVFVSESPQAPKEARESAMKIVEQAWSRPETAISLLRAIGRSRLEAQILQLQQHLKSDRPEVKAAAQYAVTRLELDKEPPIDPAKPLIGGLKFDDLIRLAEPLKGDVKYGQRLFSRQGCVACHTVSQSEPIKGPLLLDISKRYKRHELIESIVKPSAKIAQGFEAQYFVSSDGKVYEGFVVRESGEEIELRNVAGISTVLKKDDIEERGKRDISVMPQGLVDKLNAEQLAAILAYLESLKK